MIPTVLMLDLHGEGDTYSHLRIALEGEVYPQSFTELHGRYPHSFTTALFEKKGQWKS